MDKDLNMIDISKSLNLMSRMRLFPETNLAGLHEKIYVEGNGKGLLEEGVHMSYDARAMYRILLRHYNIGPEENFIENGNDIGIDFAGTYDKSGGLNSQEIAVVLLVLPKDFKDTEKIKKFFDACGWTLAQEKTYDINNQYVAITFHKARQIVEIKVPSKLYHLTPASKLKKIMSIGLVPRTSNTMSNRPERVYLFTENEDDGFFYQNMANQLFKADLERKLNFSGLSREEIGKRLRQEKREPYCLLEIETNKCGGLKLYGDPDMDGAAWTYDNIPPKAIKVINEKI